MKAGGTAHGCGFSEEDIRKTTEESAVVVVVFVFMTTCSFAKNTENQSKSNANKEMIN